MAAIYNAKTAAHNFRGHLNLNLPPPALNKGGRKFTPQFALLKPPLIFNRAGHRQTSWVGERRRALCKLIT